MVVLVAPLVWVVAVVLLAAAVRSPRLSLHQAAAGATGRWAPRGPNLGAMAATGKMTLGTEFDQLICWEWIEWIDDCFENLWILILLQKTNDMLLTWVF